MKRIQVCSLFSLFLILSLVLNPAGMAKGEKEPLEFSLADAIRYAKENNLDIRIERLNVKEKESSYKRALIVGEPEEIERTYEEFNDAQTKLDQMIESLSLQIEREYYNLLKSEMRLVDQEDAFSKAKRNYDLDSARFQAGLISELTLINSSNDLFKAGIALDNQKNALEGAKYKFRDVLGLSFDIDFILTEKIEFAFGPLAIEFEEALNIALSDSEIIKKAQKTIAEAERVVGLKDNEYTPQAELERALLDLERAKLQYEKAKNTVFFDVRTAYLNVVSQEHNVELKIRELDFASRNYQVNLVQHSQGVISDNQLENSRRAKEAAEQELKDAIWEHIGAVRELYNVMGRPLLISEGDELNG